MSTGDMPGRFVPMKGSYKGEPMRKIAESGSVVVTNYGSHAYKVESQRVAGCPIYDADSFSSYA